jgi:hypothetical protein
MREHLMGLCMSVMFLLQSRQPAWTGVFENHSPIFETIRTEAADTKLCNGRETTSIMMSSFFPGKHKSNGIFQHHIQKSVSKQKTWGKRKKIKH